MLCNSNTASLPKKCMHVRATKLHLHIQTVYVTLSWESACAQLVLQKKFTSQ